jgi:hypothetical protein
MADTGAPWEIPYAEPGDLVRDWPALSEDVADAVADGLTASSPFDSVDEITATDASWPVPTLANPIVRVTVVGGGGGAGAGRSIGNVVGQGNAGTAGGNTVFGVGESFEVTAAGGAGGPSGTYDVGSNGDGFLYPLRALNYGRRANPSDLWDTRCNGGDGRGGEVKVLFIDLTGKTTLNVTIGAGGAAGTALGSTAPGGVGGAGVRGAVFVEYKAG